MCDSVRSSDLIWYTLQGYSGADDRRADLGWDRSLDKRNDGRKGDAPLRTERSKAASVGRLLHLPLSLSQERPEAVVRHPRLFA